MASPVTPGESTLRLIPLEWSLGLFVGIVDVRGLQERWGADGMLEVFPWGRLAFIDELAGV